MTGVYETDVFGNVVGTWFYQWETKHHASVVLVAKNAHTLPSFNRGPDAHCGACGVVCDPDEQCVAAGWPFDISTCGNKCVAIPVVPGDECFDAEDEDLCQNPQYIPGGRGNSTVSVAQKAATTSAAI